MEGHYRRRRRGCSATHQADPVAADSSATGAGEAVRRGGGGGGQMTTLGIGRLAAPLDASVLKPDFDLRLDETKLSCQIAPELYNATLTDA